MDDREKYALTRPYRLALALLVTRAHRDDDFKQKALAALAEWTDLNPHDNAVIDDAIRDQLLKKKKPRDLNWQGDDPPF